MKVHRRDAGVETGSLHQVSAAPVAARAGRSGTVLVAEPTEAASIPLRRGLGPAAQTGPATQSGPCTQSGSATQSGPSGRVLTSGAAAIYAPLDDSQPTVQWPAARPRHTLRWLPAVTPLERDDAIYYRVCCQLKRYLRDPRKPLIVVIADSSDSDLFQRAITAYGSSSPLRAAADLVLALSGPAEQAGGGELRAEDRKSLLLAIDRYDLYGNAALFCPQEPQQELTELLRIARDRRGVMLVAESDSPPAPKIGVRDVGGRDVGGRDVGGRDVGGRDIGGRDVGGWLASHGWDAVDGWTVESADPGLALELLASDLGVPVVSAEWDDLADHCGSLLVDPQAWAELSRETQQIAVDRRWQICNLGYSAFGRRLLESRRRRHVRPSGGRYPTLGTMLPMPARPIPVAGSPGCDPKPAVAAGSVSDAPVTDASVTDASVTDVSGVSRAERSAQVSVVDTAAAAAG